MVPPQGRINIVLKLILLVGLPPKLSIHEGLSNISKPIRYHLKIIIHNHRKTDEHKKI